jgi:hypothetical protein
MVDITTLMTNLRETLEQRQQKVSEMLSPIDLSKIATTIKKLKSALLDNKVSNPSLVKKNNSLLVELSFMPEEMREKIRGAPFKRESQRTDPHYLIPDGNNFVFQRSNPNDPIVSELQTCSYYYRSISHLLDEADDVMNIIKSNGTQVDAEQKDQGSDAQGASSTAPQIAPSAQIATTDGEQKGANKRSHDTIVAPGHKLHTSRAQRMSQADNNNQSSSTATSMATPPALSFVAPTTRIRKEIRDVAAPARQSSLSIPVAPAATPTAQAMVLVDHTTAEIALHPTAQAVPVAPTFQQLTASVLSAPATHAYLAAPEYPYSTIGRQQSRYAFGRNDVPSQDDFYGSGDAYGNPQNYYGNRNARFAMSKGKGKGKPFNAKGTRGASNSWKKADGC